MSLDMQSVLPLVASENAAAEEDTEAEARRETIITFAVTTFAVLFASFVAVVMALA